MRACRPTRMGALLALALAGCRHGVPDDEGDPGEPADTADVADDTERVVHLFGVDQPNLLLAYDLDVDAARRRAWVTGIVTSTVAEVDIDAGTLVKMHDLGAGNNPVLPEVSVDGAGTAWVSGGTSLPLARIDPATGEVVIVETGVRRLDHVVALEEGGAVAIGATGTDEPVLVRIAADGTPGAPHPLDGHGVAIALVDGGGAVAVELSQGEGSEPRVDVFDVSTFAAVRTCPAPFVANFLGEVQDGRLAMTHNTMIGILDCEAGTSVTKELGEENKDAFAIGDEVLVLDRIGTDEAAGANWGIARRFDVGLTERGEPFATGKNSGYGGLDPTTGVLWMNSEGTTEAMGFHAETGELAARVRVGLHLESIATDPAEPTVVWITGRLSGLLARVDLDTKTVLESEDDLGWPVAPVVAGGSLWVLDQLTQQLYQLDPATLEVVARHDLGLDDNVLLTFDALVWHPGRGTLFLSASQENQLLEIGLDGAVLGAWGLGGPPIGSPDATGVVDLAVAGDVVIAYRTDDGALTRVDPATGEVTQVEVDAAIREAVSYDTLPRVLAALADGSAFYLGGFAHDPATLARLPDRDLPGVSRILAETDGGLLAWSSGEGVVHTLDAAGQVVSSTALARSSYGDPAVTWLPGWGRFAYFREDRAQVRAVVLEAP